MLNRLSAAGIAGCLVLPLAVAAQQPGRAVRLASSRPEAERPLIERAIHEVSNIGAARSDKLLEELLAAQPDAGLPRALRAAMSQNLLLADRRKELDQAVQDAAKASTPELVLVTALREWRYGRTADALALLDAAAHLMPGEPLVEFYRVLMSTDAGERLKAAEAAHTKFPSDPGIMNLLAYARYNSGFEQEGLAVVREYVQAAPDHPNSHDSYGELLHLDGDLVGAEAEYRRAIELDPTLPGPHIGAAAVALSKGDVRAVRSHMQTALPLSREPVERIGYLVRAGWAAALNDDAGDMRRYFEQAAALSDAAGNTSGQADFVFYRALAEATLGNRSQAATLYLDPPLKGWESAYAGLGRACVFSLTGNQTEMDAGITEQEHAAQVAGNTGLPVEALHLARLAKAAVTGDVATARSELTQLKLPAYVAMGHAYLARALTAAKDTKGAADERALAHKSYPAFDGNRAFIALVMR